MELLEFLRQTQSEVRREAAERLGAVDGPYPYTESMFTEVVMQHMSEVGMTFEPQACQFERKIGNAVLRLSGYAMSEEADQVDLFVSLYKNADELIELSDQDTKKAAEQCLRFFTECCRGKLAKHIDESEEVYPFVRKIPQILGGLDQIRIYVLTDGTVKSKNFQAREVEGKIIKLEVMDIERLHRHLSEGKPRDELEVDFEKLSGGPLPCVYVPVEGTDYDYVLTAFPGEALRFIYEKYGARLLEANVRSFLSTAGKVNRGIRDTLREAPERFMAYNNGIVLTADEARIGRTKDGAQGVLWLKGMQIVNGGQTTASIYFTKKKEPIVDLGRVRVPAKIVVLKKGDAADEETLVADISRYANSQNAVKLSDLSANKPFHVELEKLSRSVYCLDGVSRWFYERAAGSYKTMLAREGATPAKLKKLRESIPSERKITKTDLAKFIHAWDGKPDWVSLGSQKNFEQFMEALAERLGPNVPAAVDYKMMVAKAIIYKAAQRVVRPLVPAFQANVTAYLVCLLANRLGSTFSLERVWERQGLSEKLVEQLRIWAKEVHSVLRQIAGDLMISECAKKPECRARAMAASYSAPLEDIPEVGG
jgi:hypothetical protein